MVAIGSLSAQEWPWLLSRSAATAWAHVPEVLQSDTTPEQVAAQARQTLAGLLSQPPNVALVAREGGSPVGYLVVALLPDELTGAATALYYDIFVEPSHRGTGLSNRLTAAGEQYCRALGVRVVRRMVSPQNLSSLRHALADGCIPERVGFIKVI